MSEDTARPAGDPIHVDEVVVVNEPRDVRVRQILLTTVIVLLAIWTAWEFLTPLAWAVVIAIAEWPIYRRLERRFPNRPNLLAFALALLTALFVIGPLSLAAVSLAQES